MSSTDVWGFGAPSYIMFWLSDEDSDDSLSMLQVLRQGGESTTDGPEHVRKSARS